MEKIYWVQEWAKIRQDEVVRLPDSFDVHSCFLNSVSRAEFDSVFDEIWNMYVDIYGDIKESPERFGMPLYKTEEYNWLLSWKTHLLLYLRIRNVSKCLEYIEQCPDSVKQIFLHGDSGCENRVKGTCKYGQEYTIDGTTYWRCGCCNAPFYFQPVKEDIPHYIKLVELGGKK